MRIIILVHLLEVWHSSLMHDYMLTTVQDIGVYLVLFYGGWLEDKAHW